MTFFSDANTRDRSNRKGPKYRIYRVIILSLREKTFSLVKTDSLIKERQKNL